MQNASRDPLHGKTLNMIVEALVKKFGWEELGTRIPIKCFTTKPSVKSSLVFLRKTPWARTKVEELYIAAIFRAQKETDEVKPLGLDLDL